MVYKLLKKLPFPGPPAENDPPPPSNDINTENVKKSGSLVLHPSNPTTKCTNSGKGCQLCPTLFKLSFN
ncbi:hypothetical protein A3Q56_06085 [Intoshia linei]|uniref:Uncharacterized protein n=1 Tax=Intoshia linei TaxID=1819745 RepID=A0A177AYD2_9BILA|nr:hypothetical protein A3Q56_06085 [Intoshia linei]